MQLETGKEWIEWMAKAWKADYANSEQRKAKAWAWKITEPTGK